MHTPLRPRVLFLEDEFLTRLTAVEALSEAGYDVVGAKSLEEARHLLSQPNAHFDLLALNIELGDGNGIDLCDELRRGGCKLPILMHSGHAHQPMLVRAMRAGATDYLLKPYNHQELVERVQFLLDLPPVVRAVIRPHGERGSNIPTVQTYTNPFVTAAIVRLQNIRPMPGTLPVHERGQGEDERRDIRIVPLDEQGADHLQKTLEEIRELLKQQHPDPETVDNLRAALIGSLSAITSWLAGRATVVTDEALKRFTTLAIAAYAAHVMGLKVDLMHIIAALAALGGLGR